MEYKPSKLREYIQNSELRIVNDNFRIRLSPELAKIYDAGGYNHRIATHAEHINAIIELGIKYPGRANPIFYIYIVPDENFVELLSFPWPNAKNGGKPVSSFDLDGFDSAYGLSQNMLMRKSTEETISWHVNNIHEFAHLVHGQFFNKNRILSEGFAELLPLYTMGLEEEFEEHREVIKNMKPEDIISPQELLSMGRDGSFGKKTQAPDKSRSFDWSYISSYLFVRGYIAKVAEKFGLDRIGATQKFLEIVRASQCSYQFLILDLANAIGISGDEALGTKTLQLTAQEEIAKI